MFEFLEKLEIISVAETCSLDAIEVEDVVDLYMSWDAIDDTREMERSEMKGKMLNGLLEYNARSINPVNEDLLRRSSIAIPPTCSNEVRDIESQLIVKIHYHTT